MLKVFSDSQVLSAKPFYFGMCQYYIANYSPYLYAFSTLLLILIGSTAKIEDKQFKQRTKFKNKKLIKENARFLCIHLKNHMEFSLWMIMGEFTKCKRKLTTYEGPQWSIIGIYISMN